MRTSELRIGNYIKLMLNNGDFAVIEVTLNDLEAIDNKKGIFEPIPLTEEWLLKFGFEKFVEHTPSFGHDDIYRKRYIDINGRYNQYHFRNILIESVHELQNLYFALTKEELTMK